MQRALEGGLAPWTPAMSGRESDDEAEQGASAAPKAGRAKPGDETMTKRTESGTGEDDAAKQLRRVRASEVLGPRGILLIEHEGETYTLRLTRNNRLILTK